ncbi:hypothetical protein B0H16DRAFT_1689430 [Mycena metata]|uniref:DUF6535 domain-containing protein n=1 Tax=Mycena metata TaxID=1033252 RepID=A0AAD7J7L4_9AGAR|nr:hypothetical protein B0H16DRAFT_1689430 [Mycena metata]
MASIEDTDVEPRADDKKAASKTDIEPIADNEPQSALPPASSSIPPSTNTSGTEAQPELLPDNERPVNTLQASSGTAPLGASFPVPLPPKENAKIDHGADTHKRHRPLNKPSPPPPAASGGNAVLQPLADSERLISTLQDCFANLLKEQKEQTNRLIEELKPKPPPTTDKKTEFWKAYKTIADEYDKDYRENMSLTSAGLFSAVDSAFIIQIQPEIQPQGSSQIILIAECLLYASLSLALLAALLAVLGKQWLVYYAAAGERGSIESRGLDRQRKLDGLRKWKFDALMQLFPLLLQFALLVFSAALSTYLWTIHHSLAIIVMSFTSLGVVAYFLLLASAMFSQDSPFQTPLAHFTVHLVPRSWRSRSRAVLKEGFIQFKELIGHISTVSSSYIQCSQDLLPCFTKQQTKSLIPEKPALLFSMTDIKTSSEIPAVSWVLQTSTDPVMLAQTAHLIIDLQWPSNMDVQPQMNRLWENFLACFKYHNDYDDDDCLELDEIRDGMHDRAVQLGRFLYRPSLMLNNSVNLKWILDGLPLVYQRHTKISYLETLLVKLEDSTLDLDCAEFSDYLFCVYAFLVDGEPSRSDTLCLDKSMDFAKKIIQTTHRLAGSSNDNKGWNFPAEDRRFIIYQFCGQLPKSEGWVNLVLTTGLLTHKWGGIPSEPAENLSGADWIYDTLKSSVIPTEDTAEWDGETAAGIAGLLLALCDYGAPPLKEHTHLILHAISIGGDILKPVGLLVLQPNFMNWFQDPKLGPMLQEASVWTFITNWNKQTVSYYWDNKCIVLGHALAEIPSWQSYLRQHLCSWITLFFNSNGRLVEEYDSAIINIWKPATSGYTFRNSHEEALGLTYTILSQFWKEFDFSMSKSQEWMSELYCSRQVVFSETLRMVQGDEQVELHFDVTKATDFTNTFSIPLRSSFVQAAGAARHEIMQHSQEESSKGWVGVLEQVAKMLDDVANNMPIPTDLEKDKDHWKNVEIQSYKEFDKLEELLGKLTSGSQINVWIVVEFPPYLLKFCKEYSSAQLRAILDDDDDSHLEMWRKDPFIYCSDTMRGQVEGNCTRGALTHPG